LSDSDPPGEAADEVVPAAELRSDFEIAAPLMMKAIGQGVWSRITRDVRWTLVFVVLGFVVAWVANVVIVAIIYEGGGKIPAGGPAVGQVNQVAGSLFWFLGMAVLFGIVVYARQVGGRQFTADLRSVPGALGRLMRSDGDGAVVHGLWGVAVAMIVAAAVTPSYCLLLAVVTLVLLVKPLRILIAGWLMLAWRKGVGAVAPQHTKPPSPQALSVVMEGAVLGFIAASGVSDPSLKLLGGLGAAVIAFVLGQRRGPAKVALLLLCAAGATVLVLGQDLMAWAADGGWRENGGDFNAWLNGGGQSVMSDSVLGGVFGSGGSVLGGGVAAVSLEQMMQMQNQDASSARTIQTQMQEDAQKEQMMRWKILQDTQTKLFEVQQDVTSNKAKTQDKAYNKWDQYIRA
jgi:hypothetical protein